MAVEPEDIDRLLAELAKGSRLSTTQLLAAVAEMGMDEAAYRAELKRQILALRASERWLADETTGGARAATTSRDLDAARGRMLTTLRERAYVEVRK